MSADLPSYDPVRGASLHEPAKPRIERLADLERILKTDPRPDVRREATRQFLNLTEPVTLEDLL